MLFKMHFIPRERKIDEISNQFLKDNHLNFQKITRNLVLPLSVIVQSRDQYNIFQQNLT